MRNASRTDGRMDGWTAASRAQPLCVCVVSTERQTSAFRVIAGGRACVWVGSFIHSFIHVVVVVRADGGA